MAQGDKEKEQENDDEKEEMGVDSSEVNIGIEGGG